LLANILFHCGKPAVIPLTAGGLNTTAKGDIAEQAVILALITAGKAVLTTISNGLRYDLVIDDLDGSLYACAVQDGHAQPLRSGAQLSPVQADAPRPNRVPHLGQVDAFGVYCCRRRGIIIACAAHG
jgi:PD-(D/E)XK endonuclease